MTAEELAARPAIDVGKLTHECPACHWLLADGGFCIHGNRQTGDVEAVYDGVPRQDGDPR